MMTATRPEFFSRRSAGYTIRLVIVSALMLSGFSWISPAPDVEANEAEFQQALDRINTYRSWIGIEPLEMDPALMNAAQSHSDYWELNSGNMPGLHNQTPGAPGYTGVSMSDRASHFGYEGSINENVGLSGSMLSTVNWSIATISHRQTLLDPRYTDVGFGAVTTQSGGMETIILGSQSWSNSVEPVWQAWPVNGTTGVGLRMQGSVPSPISNAPYPVGYPITLKYHGGGSVEFHGATLRANGSTVPSISGVGDGWLSRNTMMIMASDPMQPNTTYEVTVEATANGEPANRTWSFTTGDSDSSLPSLDGATPPSPSSPPEPEITFPERLDAANSAFQDTWAGADAPVHQHEVDRSWLWGPDTFMTGQESYADSPGGNRDVAYFDKSRMEINDPDADSSSQWFVTNGLLVRDMIRGAIQTGDRQFDEREPAQIAIAGDNLAANPDAPTYASLREHSAVIPETRQPDRTGEAVMTQLSARGTLHHGPEVPEGVSYAYFDDVTGFNVADVFWDVISSAEHYDWIYAVGHPITDPHWVYTSVGGEDQWVLVQAFQRRLLTYTPANDDDWQIEMGNVGRHYYSWRYNEAPPH